MRAFNYHAPESVSEAVSLLASAPGDSKIMAGGTDLLVLMRRGKFAPANVVDIKRIPELSNHNFDSETGLTFGAAVSCAVLCESEQVTSNYPGLVDAFSLIGGIATQGRATVGGNVSNAAPSADSIPPLIVHRAQCRIAGPDGERMLPIEEFCTGPSTNVLGQDEVLVSIQVPPPAPDSAGAYLRFIPRGEMDIAVAGVAAWLRFEDEMIADACVALTSVAPTPLPAPEAGEFLVGKPATAETFTEAGDIAARAARPITDHRGSAEQRRQLVRTLSIRTLETAAARVLKGGRQS